MGNRAVGRCLCCLKPANEVRHARELSAASDHTIQDPTSPAKVETWEQTPIHASEKVVPDSKWDVKAVTSALSEAAAAIVTIAESTDELPLLVNKPEVKVYGKESPHGFLMKTCWEVAVSPEVFLEFARNRDYRPEWDANIDQCILVSQITSDIDAVYERYKKVALVSQRDVLVASTVLERADALVAVSTSIESSVMPPVHGILRARMHVGGYYVQATPRGAAVTSVSELNFGGSLPNSLLVRMTSMTMPGYVKALTSALNLHSAANV